MGIRVLFYMTTVIRHFPSARSTFEKKIFVRCKAFLRGEGEIFSRPFFLSTVNKNIVTLIHGTKKRESRLMAKWNSGQRWSACCQGKKV